MAAKKKAKKKVKKMKTITDPEMLLAGLRGNRGHIPTIASNTSKKRFW